MQTIAAVVAHTVVSANSCAHHWRPDPRATLVTFARFQKIPTDVVRALDKKNYSFERLYDLDAHQLGELVRMPKMGKPLYKFIRQVHGSIFHPL